MKQKHLVIGLSLLIFLACIVISSSFAWFTDHDNAVNRVQLGKLGIDLIETTKEKDAIVTENGIQYTNPILPGVATSKIVDIENVKDLDVYLRLEVRRLWVDDKGNVVDDLDPNLIEINDIDEKVWLSMPSSVSGKEYYYLRTALSPKQVVNLFQTFEVSKTLTDNERYGDHFAQIKIDATAIQTLDEAMQEQGWDDVQIVDGHIEKK